MKPETTKLTIRLPRRSVEFAKSYARAHGLSVTEVIERYLARLRALESTQTSPELEEISGLVPSDVDAEAEHRRDILDKHR